MASIAPLLGDCHCVEHRAATKPHSVICVGDPCLVVQITGYSVSGRRSSLCVHLCQHCACVHSLCIVYHFVGRAANAARRCSRLDRQSR